VLQTDDQSDQACKLHVWPWMIKIIRVKYHFETRIIPQALRTCYDFGFCAEQRQHGDQERRVGSLLALNGMSATFACQDVAAYHGSSIKGALYYLVLMMSCLPWDAAQGRVEVGRHGLRQ